jgi:NAD(P)-dependent dehydrogenase (short-subunit alcohol dehydrogenase family)
MASLANKVGIVTGGGTSIVRATASAMAKAGASLVIGNRNAKLGDGVVRAIERAGGRAAFQVTDVSKPEDATALMESTRQPKTDTDCLRRLPSGRTNCAARDRRKFM